MIFSLSSLGQAALNLPPPIQHQIELKFGKTALQRVLKWQQLLISTQSLPELQQLESVNRFFNQTLRFEEDALLWLKADYWATPIEALAQGAGDCEDYAIAKYYSLRELGIPDTKLRITYVKAKQLNRAHMVVTYFANPRAVPIVLDNLTPELLPATARRDLVPVYSFNAAGLWLAQAKGLGQQVSGAERLSLWADVNYRMSSNLF